MRYTLLLLVTFGVVAASDSLELRIWSPETIVWQRVDPDGTKYAVLDGDREKAGAPLTYAFWMPGGVWVKPHTHTQQAHVVVVKGSIRLGYGAKMDRAKAIEMKAGGWGVPDHRNCAGWMEDKGAGVSDDTDRSDCLFEPILARALR